MPETAVAGTAQEPETAQLPQSMSPVVGLAQARRLVLRQGGRRQHRGDLARAGAAVVAQAVDVEAIAGGVVSTLNCTVLPRLTLICVA